MGWPKGVPRKGYVNKDGTTHATKKDRLDFTKEPKPTKVQNLLASRPPELTPELHGMTGRPITEPCPLCMYAYADGGYCTECGWNKAIRVDEYGTHSGGKLCRRRRNSHTRSS